MSKKTIIIGASPKPERFSNKAAKMLRQYGHEIIAIGNKLGNIDGIPIIKDKIWVEGVDTVTMYIGKRHQTEYYEYLTEVIRPKRIIFNPGSENIELEMLAKENGIEVLHHCTLVMLRVDEY
jgi:uncharacterized protein